MKWRMMSSTLNPQEKVYFWPISIRLFVLFSILLLVHQVRFLLDFFRKYDLNVPEVLYQTLLQHAAPCNWVYLYCKLTSGLLYSYNTRKSALNLDVNFFSFLKYEICEKPDDFCFPIVNYSFCTRNIPSVLSYGSYISQLICYACAFSQDTYLIQRKCARNTNTKQFPPWLHDIFCGHQVCTFNSWLFPLLLWITVYGQTE